MLLLVGVALAAISRESSSELLASTAKDASVTPASTVHKERLLSLEDDKLAAQRRLGALAQRKTLLIAQHSIAMNATETSLESDHQVVDSARVKSDPNLLSNQEFQDALAAQQAQIAHCKACAEEENKYLSAIQEVTRAHTEAEAYMIHYTLSSQNLFDLQSEIQRSETEFNKLESHLECKELDVDSNPRDFDSIINQVTALKQKSSIIVQNQATMTKVAEQLQVMYRTYELQYVARVDKLEKDKAAIKFTRDQVCGDKSVYVDLTVSEAEKGLVKKIAEKTAKVAQARGGAGVKAADFAQPEENQA